MEFILTLRSVYLEMWNPTDFSKITYIPHVTIQNTCGPENFRKFRKCFTFSTNLLTWKIFRSFSKNLKSILKYINLQNHQSLWVYKHFWHSCLVLTRLSCSLHQIFIWCDLIQCSHDLVGATRRVGEFHRAWNKTSSLIGSGVNSSYATATQTEVVLISNVLFCFRLNRGIFVK